MHANTKQINQVIRKTFTSTTTQSTAFPWIPPMTSCSPAPAMTEPFNYSIFVARTPPKHSPPPILLFTLLCIIPRSRGFSSPPTAEMALSSGTFESRTLRSFSTVRPPAIAGNLPVETRVNKPVCSLDLTLTGRASWF